MTPRFDSNLSAAYDYGMKLVLIEWVDSFGCSSNWQEIKDDLQPAPITVKSVGWLAHDGIVCKTLIPHVSDAHESANAQGCGDMTIPASSIMRIVELVIPPNSKKKPSKRTRKKRTKTSGDR